MFLNDKTILFCLHSAVVLNHYFGINKNERIMKWMASSGLKVKNSKTEMSIFHRTESRIATMTINDTIKRSTPTNKDDGSSTGEQTGD